MKTRRLCQLRWLVQGGVYYVAVFVIGGILALYGDPFYVQVALGVTISVILALSWDILARTGQTSFGHSAFFGIGAYTTAILHGPLGIVGSWIAGVILSMIVAVLFGRALFKLRGVYFSVTTFSFSLVLPVVALVLTPVTGGAGGITPHVIAGGDRRLQLLVCMAFLIIAMATSDYFLQVRHRTAAFLIRSHPELASSSGISVVNTKVLTFGVSGGLAALAGALYGGLYGFIVPADVFTLNWSVLPFTVALLGGVDSTLGPIIGGVVLRLLEEQSKEIIGSHGYQVVVGLVIILCITLMPEGILGLLKLIRRRRARVWKTTSL